MGRVGVGVTTTPNSPDAPTPTNPTDCANAQGSWVKGQCYGATVGCSNGQVLLNGVCTSGLNTPTQASCTASGGTWITQNVDTTYGGCCVLPGVPTTQSACLAQQGQWNSFNSMCALTNPALATNAAYVNQQCQAWGGTYQQTVNTDGSVAIACNSSCSGGIAGSVVNQQQISTFCTQLGGTIAQGSTTGGGKYACGSQGAVPIPWNGCAFMIPAPSQTGGTTTTGSALSLQACYAIGQTNCLSMNPPGTWNNTTGTCTATNGQTTVASYPAGASACVFTPGSQATTSNTALIVGGVTVAAAGALYYAWREGLLKGLL
jgi:hypothetical protein